MALSLCAVVGLGAGQGKAQPVLACVGPTWFEGEARPDGSLEGRLADGTACAGTWARQALGTGVSEVTCADGTTGRVLYTYRDPATGTARGTGGTGDGRPIYAWSGDLVRPYLRDRAPDVAALCGVAVPLS